MRVPGISANLSSDDTKKTTGLPPLLDSFITTIAFSRISFPEEIKKWVDTIRFVPAFGFYRGSNGTQCFYRFSAMHELIPVDLPLVTPFFIHIGLAEFDFLVQVMSPKPLGVNTFYEYYPAAVTLSQSGQAKDLPNGGQWHAVDGKEYLRLFHHTTAEGKRGILSDKYLKSSKYNFAGTRCLTHGHVYLTDINAARSLFDTLPILKSTSRGVEIAFRTDDLSGIAASDIAIDDRALTDRICLLVHPEIVEPNPMVRHFAFESQPDWLEIMFSRIYRCPCNGLRLDRNVTIEGETHWIVDSENASNFRSTDPICCANGNSLDALQKMIDDSYLD